MNFGQSESAESGLSNREERELLGMMDTPSYLRRSRRVEEAMDLIGRRCAAAREERLFGVRLRLRAWNRLATDRPSLEATLGADARSRLAALNDAVFSTFVGRISRGPAAWPVLPGRMWKGIHQAVVEFNSRWTAYVESLDFQPVNKLVDLYNRHYVFEKECALRSARLARLGFQPLPHLDAAWVWQRWPALLDLPPRRS